MAITIKYNGYTFSGTGEDLLLLAPTAPPDMYEVWHPISEALEWDTLTFGVRSDATGTKYIFTSLGQIYSTSSNEEYVIDDGDLSEYTRGTPVQVYKDGALYRTFYLDSITARAGGIFEFSAVSLVGLLTERYHRGDVYSGVTAEAILDDIFAGVPYTIDADVAEVTLYGWLPYDTARANLSRVLFATGASLMKTDTGAPYIRFNQPQTSKDVSANTYYDRDSVPVEHYGTIRVIEHTFYNSSAAASKVLFDNRNSTAANNALIVFDEPQASVGAGGGLTLVSYGANWAIVNGTGYLEGTPYVHIRRVLEQATGDSSAEQKEIADNALISSLNSGSVLDRLVNYYTNAVRHTITTKHTVEQPGEIITFPARSGKQVSGYISTLDNAVSGFTKSTMDVIGNWTPKGFGNLYTEYFVLRTTSSGRFTIPTAHRGKRALVVLFGGAQGGFGGMDGERGHSGRPYSDNVVSRGYGGIGGLGGEPGAGGGPGRYLTAEISSLAASYTGSIGAGGQGGQRAEYGQELEEGQLGGDTVFGDFTTADGNVLEGPYVNMIDGTVYGEEGGLGNWGKDGGNGGDLLQANKKGDPGTAGQDYNTVWKGGAGGLGVKYGTVTASGGGGGGAAYGSSAQNSTQYTDAVNYATNGADAMDPPQADFYRGGTGGNGGGGGGGSSYRYNGLSANFRDPGRGGYGSYGGQGADGFVLVYV